MLMRAPITFGSVCSGIEAASVAWASLGWRCSFVSDIDAFACAVLAHHYRDVPNLGDMTAYMEWPDATLDVFCGGTPCQSYSIAGNRKGLGDERGALMLAFAHAAHRFAARWLVWENVAGVLSVDDGRAFGALLGLLAKLGYGFAYRVFDAQYFALAQRRSRVFVIGYPGDWRPPAAVLFERAGLLGHPAPSRSKGQGVTGTLSARTRGGGGLGTDFECGGGLIPDIARALTGSNERQDAAVETLLPISFGANMSTPFFGDDIGGTVQAKNPGAVLQPTHGVRRLTPRECERLQGFPDDYTRVPYRGALAADGPRYRAIGNSMPVPVMRWIGERIAMVDAILMGQ